MTTATEHTRTVDQHVPTPAGRPSLRRADRLAAAAGTAFVAAILAGNSMTESVVGDDDSVAGTASDLAAQAGSAVARSGLVLEVAGLFLLLLFAAGVATLGLRHAAARTVTVLVPVAAVLLVAVKLGSAAPYLAAMHLDGLSDDVRHALVEVNGVAFVITWLPLALLVGASAAVLGRARLVGRVLTWSGYLLAAVGLAVGLLGVASPTSAVPVPFLLSLLWVGATGLRVAAFPLPDVRGVRGGRRGR